ncbi:hypothetical protein ACFX2F_005965 [Malus domestica]
MFSPNNSTTNPFEQLAALVSLLIRRQCHARRLGLSSSRHSLRPHPPHLRQVALSSSPPPPPGKLCHRLSGPRSQPLPELPHLHIGHKLGQH